MVGWAGNPLVDQTMHETTFDILRRPQRTLRVSVTDRCNLRCRYCMPEREYVWLPRHDLLTFEEIERLVGLFTGIGVGKVRLTGGEPLLRHDLPRLIEALARNPHLRDLAMTTNGILLTEHARALRQAGLHRLSVSLDTLQPERFRALTWHGNLDQVLAGIDAAGAAGLEQLKIDTVVLRGFNDDELVDLIEYGRRVDAEIRFIEYMDVGGATQWSEASLVARADILATLSRHYGSILPEPELTSAPADRFALPDGTVFGVIGSTTSPFCRTCDRSRLTADGQWYLCLYAEESIDLRSPLRDGATDEEIATIIRTAWSRRTDRGAEVRHAATERSASVSRDRLRDDPHLEMHTRGG